MQIYNYKIVFQEIPHEVTLAFSCLGCGGPCPNCHSPHLHEFDETKTMSLYDYKRLLSKFKDLITCVCFFGGEWFPDLTEFLSAAKSYGYKTALYSGADEVDPDLIPFLDYYKIGPYQQDKGGLDNPNTNQRFYRIKSGELIDETYLFRKEPLKHD